MPSEPRLKVPQERLEPLPECSPPAREDLDALGRSRGLVAGESFRRADQDPDLLQREELRHIRLGLEYLKPELAMQRQGIVSTVVLFGGTRIVAPSEASCRREAAEQALGKNPESPDCQRALRVAERGLDNSRYYEVARQFARLISLKKSPDSGLPRWVVTTGGGPGIMEAGNRGAFDAGGKSIGLNITLPREQSPNAYVSPELCFQFRYFALRKLHFLKRARALVAFPGGYGTMDELFDALCLIQTRKILPMPVVLVGKQFWKRALDFEFLVEEGVIAAEDLDLVQWAETAEEIVEIVENTSPPRSREDG